MQNEKLVQSLTAKLKAAELELIAVKKELSAAKAANPQSPSKDNQLAGAELVELRGKYERLLKFVKANNLVFEESAPSKPKKTPEFEPSEVKTKSSSEVSFGKIVRKVEELNARLGKEKGMVFKVQPGTKRAELSSRESIKLLVFKDGLKVGEGEFLPYESKKCKELIGDILNGFFPKQLEEKYPDKVHLDLEDHVDLKFDAYFPSEKQVKRIENGVIVDPLSINQLQVKNIDFSKTIKIELNSTVECIKMLDADVLCSLKIRLPDGKIFSLKLPSSLTLSQLYDQIRKRIGFEFSLHTSYPRSLLNIKTDGAKTMEQLELAPTSFLSLEKTK